MRKLLVIPLILLAVPATAEIYRYVDENGSMVYTDQKPSEDATPVDLPGLTVMDAPKPATSPTRTSASDGSEVPEVYPDLTVLSPRREETFQGTGNTLPLRLASRQALRGSDQVVVFLDGSQQGSFTSLAVDLQDVPRGAHDVRVEIRDAQDRVVGTAGPVTFHMKQHSRLHQNQPMVNPPPAPGGGS